MNYFELIGVAAAGVRFPPALQDSATAAPASSLAVPAFLLFSQHPEGSGHEAASGPLWRPRLVVAAHVLCHVAE